MSRTPKVLRRLEKDLGINLQGRITATDKTMFVLSGITSPWKLLSRAGSSEIAYQELLTKIRTEGDL